MLFFFMILSVYYKMHEIEYTHSLKLFFLLFLRKENKRRVFVNRKWFYLEKIKVLQHLADISQCLCEMVFYSPFVYCKQLRYLIIVFAFFTAHLINSFRWAGICSTVCCINNSNSSANIFSSMFPAPSFC